MAKKETIKDLSETLCKVVDNKLEKLLDERLNVYLSKEVKQRILKFYNTEERLIRVINLFNLNVETLTKQLLKEME